MPAYSHLLDQERDQIAVMRVAGHSISAIARATCPDAPLNSNPKPLNSIWPSVCRRKTTIRKATAADTGTPMIAPKCSFRISPRSARLKKTFQIAAKKMLRR